MASADKFAVARALREIGALLEVDGENPFKVRAYENGARALEALAEDLGAVVAAGRLGELPGVGEALSKKIADLVTTGTTPVLDKLRAKHPPGILELLRVPDLGPKKIAALTAALGIKDVASLEAACAEGRVRDVKGFGEKTEQKILEGIRRMKERASDRRVLLAHALGVGEQLLDWLRGAPAVADLALAGSARRGRETVGDLDVVVATDDPAAVAARFLAFPAVASTLGSGGTKVSVRLGPAAKDLQVDLRMVPPADFATLLHHLTGSKAHHVKLRGLARDQGYTLSEWGLHRLAPGQPERGDLEAVAEMKGEKVPIAAEAELYRTLGLAFVPPELREDVGEVEAAREGRLPADLVTREDVRGFVHCHTTWSDGRNTLEEMVRAAESAGAEYFTVTDHSRAAGYAGGLDRERLLRQWDEIDAMQARTTVRLLRGTEADILEDGALDVPEDLLPRFDVIVASVHSRMKMDEDQMTARLVAAMRQPVFKIWGHALGRLLLEREPFACRVEEVLDALAASRGALEVNGDPQRLDAEPRWIRAARARGIPLVLSVDAHSTAALGHLRYAVTTARRGWARKGEVLNTRGSAEFAAAVRPV